MNYSEAGIQLLAHKLHKDYYQCCQDLKGTEIESYVDSWMIYNIRGPQSYKDSVFRAFMNLIKVDRKPK